MIDVIITAGYLPVFRSQYFSKRQQRGSANTALELRQEVACVFLCGFATDRFRLLKGSRLTGLRK